MCFETWFILKISISVFYKHLTEKMRYVYIYIFHMIYHIECIGVSQFMEVRNHCVCVSNVRSEVICQYINFALYVLQLVVDLTQSVHQPKPVWIANVKIHAFTHSVEWMQYAELTLTIVLAAIVQTVTVETLLYCVTDLNAPVMMSVHTT
jgi:hypothetical protein